MRKLYTFTTGILLLLGQITQAQPCPPPGFPDAGNTCPTAPILCENLDGYCNQINNNNVPQTFPGCPGWQLNNDEWFAFFAGTTQITIQVTPSNCTANGNLQGLQAGIYNGCGGPAMDLQCSCTENPFILESSNFVVGQVYWFVLDGCAGDVCNYTIDVLSGSTVGVPPADPGPVSGPSTACQGSSGAYSIPPATAATQYTWSLTPSSMGTISANGVNATVNWAAGASGTAELCVVASNLCYSNPTPACYTVEVIPRPTATLSGSGVLCAGSSDPVELTVTFTGNAPWSFVYTFNGAPQPAIQTSDNPYTLSVTQPGTYGLQNVTSVTGGCVGTVSGSVTINQTNISLSATVVDATCGQSNGSLNLTASNGNTPYLFSWSNGATTEDLSNIPAGNYTVTVTDEDGCTKTLSVTVDDDPISFTVSGTPTANTTCIGGNGSIDANVTPAGNYTYEWSNGATTQDISNLTPGTYTLTVTTGLTCTNTASFTVNDNPNEPNLSFTTTPSSCDFSNGSINVSVSGGVTPYTFQWSSGATTEDLNSVPAGSYSVTVTGANGCTDAADITLDNVNPPINISGTTQVNTTCIGGNGSIDLSVNPPNTYTYEWSTGATTQDLNNLPPGNYTVTVSAGGTCTATADFTIDDQPNEPNINPSVVQSTCDLPNGSINLSVSGGVAPYTFNWDNGATTSSLTNLMAGDYAVTVTGANGCTNTANITVPNNNPPININANVLANTTCIGGNGSINVTISPAGSYTFNWSTGATTQSINGLTPGTYSLTVSAGGTCTETADFTIDDDPNTPNISPNVFNSTCDLPNGSIGLSVTGSTTPYTYAWSTGASTPSLSGLLAGSYSVTVTGANGCSSTADITVDNNNPPININANVLPNTTCNGGNGSIDLSVTPPANYTYSWSTGASTQDLTGLAPGIYTVTVSAGGTCTETADFSIDDEPNTPNVSANPVESTCDLPNGSISLTVTGGVAPYTYFWSTAATTKNLNNVLAGFYYVTVTGANGCTTVADVFVDNNNPPIDVDAVVTPSTNCLNGNGSINISVFPTANYTYSWSNGAVTQDLNNIPAGLYSVTVSGAGSCSQTADFDVPEEPDFPGISYTQANATCGQNNGSINLSIEYGVPPYTYQWSNGAVTQDISNLEPDIYVVTVTGGNGCTATDGMIISNVNIPITLSGTVTPKTSCLTNNGSIALALTPSNLSINWSNSSNAATLNNLAPGTYSVTVSAGGTCTQAASFVVTDQTEVLNISPSVTPATCGLPNGAASVQANNGTAPFTYAWSPGGANTPGISSLAPGNYTVTVTSAVGCTATTTAAVPNNNIALNLNAQAADNTSCTTPNGALNLTVSPPGTYSYAWSNTAATEDISNLAPGTYGVTVSLGSSCSATGIYAVGNNTPNPVITPAITPAICGASNGAIDLSLGGAPGPYVFQWSNSSATEDIQNVLPGNYGVTVTAANGCVADTLLNVPNNTLTFSISGTAQPLTSCASNNGSVDLTVTPAGAYDIVWSNSALTEDLAGLAAGVYSVSVTESGSTCTATASFIVDDLRTYPTASATAFAELCGLSNGAVTLNVLGGQTPYTYSWTGGATSPNLNGIGAGMYEVTVTGANGCTTTASTTVPGNSVSFSISGLPTANTSCVSANGSIAVDVSPANPGSGLSYVYSWSNSASTQDIASLAPGTYALTVSAGGTCTSTATYLVGNNTQSPALAETVTPAFCGQNSGAIDLTVGAGTPPYGFSWSSGPQTEDLAALLPGPYSVTVSDANGCTTTASITVPEDVITPALSVDLTPNTACLGSNGAIDLSVFPPITYTYQWAGGQATPDLSNLAPGTYAVTVSAGGSCTSVGTYTIDNAAALPQLTGVKTDVACFGNPSGAINLTVTGGVLPYGYAWSPTIAGNPQDPTGLAAGNYSVTVTDAVGCSQTASFVIQQPASAVQLACAATGTVSFPGASDGSGTLTISGGVAPYTTVVSPGATTANVPAGTLPLSNLVQGPYNVLITDANGCTATCNFAINLINCETAVGQMSAAPIILCGDGCASASYNALGQFLEPGDVLQFILHSGNGNQIVNEIARSNQPVFCFNPATMSYGTTYYISAAAGNNDGAGNVLLSHYCTVVSFGTPVTFREKPAAVIAPPDVLNCVNEQVTLSGSSSLAGAVFAWSTFGGQIVGNANQATVLAVQEGVYRLIIDAGGCRDTATAQVQDLTNQPLASIEADPKDLLDCKVNQIILSGLIEGTLSANAIWLSNGVVYANGTVLTIDDPGLYTFVVLDTLSLCSDTAQIVINEDLAFPPLFVNPAGLLSCANNVVTLSGGSPVAGVSFRWAIINGPDTLTIGQGSSVNVSAPGVYYLIGFDPINGCLNAQPVTVNADYQAPLADAGASFTLDCYGETGYLNGSGSSGAPNLGFFWTTTNGSLVAGINTPTPEIDRPGTYVLVVTNPLNGCTDSDVVVIDPEAPVPNLAIQQPPCYGDKGAVEVTAVVGARPPVRFSFDDGQTFTTQTFFPNLEPGPYTLFLVDAVGCSATATFDIEQPEEVLLFLEAQALVKLGYTYQIDAQTNLTDDQIGYIYWSPNTGLSCDSCLTPEVTPYNSIRYKLTVANKAGCEATAPILLLVDRSADIYVPNIFSPDGDGNNDVFTIFANTKTVTNIRSLQIYTRWGEMVYDNYDFPPNDLTEGWNGVFRDRPLNPAVFVWYAVVEFVDGRTEQLSGDVTLKR